MIYSINLRTSALLFTTLLIGGCGSLLGGGKPADLFRFGVAQRPPIADAQGALPTRMVLIGPRFSEEIEGDRILTTRGEQALYIKGARWVAPVPDLLAQALTLKFASRTPETRLTGARNATGASHGLQIGIDRFEASYSVELDQKAPPTIIIQGEATLFDLASRQPIASSRFSIEEPASTNTTSGIVAAFDRAVDQYTGALADWSVEARSKH